VINMRGTAFTLVLMAAAGCTSSNQVTFEHRSEVDTRARGVALLEDNESAQVGMSGNTCEVATESGMIGSDYDVAVGEDDNVQDAMGTSTLVVGQGGVYQVDQGFWGPGSALVDMSGVVTARFSDAGVVVGRDSVDGPAIDWFEGGVRTYTTSVDDSAQLSGFTVDRATGITFVPTGDDLVIADPANGVSSAGTAADMASWDPVANVLYVAQLGSSEVRGLEADGTLRWAADVGGPVGSLDDMNGSVAVMVGDESWGQIVVLDGQTGDTVGDIETPSTAKQILAGDGGKTLAVVLDSRVHFFGVNLSAGE